MQLTKAELAIRTLEYLFGALFGVFVAVLGTSVHRAYAPFALIFVLIAVLICAVMMRAWLGLGGIAAFGIGWLVAVQVFTLEGPGGDIVLPAQYQTYVWLVGGLFMLGLACFTPRKWYAE
jgi:hypothetical protein